MRRPRIPLYVQLLAWLALNLVLIGVLLYAFAPHNQTGWNLLLTESVRDRLEAIGQRVAADLYDVPESEWGAVLAKHGVEDGEARFSARRLGGPPSGPDRLGGGPGGPPGPGKGVGGPPGLDGLMAGPGRDEGPPGARLEEADRGRVFGPPGTELGPGTGPGSRPGTDARPRFINIRRSVGATGYDVAIDVSTAPGRGPPHDVQITAHVTDTRALLSLLGIGHEIA